MPDDDHSPISAKRRETPVRGLEGRAGARARGFRRPGFDRADVARGALAPRPGARPAPDRRHRRSWLARRGRARGARRQAAGAQPRSAASHAALDRRQAENRIAGRGADRRATACWRRRRGSSGATHILTAHTRDDQAETLLMRMLRGSGIAGLAAMARESERDGVRAGASVSGCFEIAADRDAEEGQDRLRRRSDQPRSEFHPAAAARADAGARRRGRRCAQSGAAGVAAGPRQCGGGSAGRRRRALSRAEGSRRAPAIDAGASMPSLDAKTFDAEAFAAMPEEIRLRLLLRAIDRFGHEGPAELGKVEALLSALDRAAARKAPEAGRSRPAKAETDPCRRAGQPGRRPDPHRAGAAPPPPGRTEARIEWCRRIIGGSARES